MTTRQAIREAEARRARLRRRLQAYGRWQPFADATPVRTHVNAIRSTGMGVANLSEKTGVSIATIDHLLYGSGDYPPAAQLRTESAQALLAYWPTLDDYYDGAIIDATGTRRRIQALAAIGWPSNAIQQRVNHITLKAVERLRINDRVTARTARAIRDLYDEVSEKRAEDYGVTPWVAVRSRTYATKNEYAAPIAWDPDTIDDPNAHPDWTGFCGTDRGFWAHSLHQLPMCSRCKAAHEEWLDEHADLSAQELNQARFRARNAAAHREADLAHDARELMRVSGLDVQLAAERLGVTRNHLQQVLLRHPELEGAAA
jgi:transcriptional regulator with XRE-family HTH domain